CRGVGGGVRVLGSARPYQVRRGGSEGAGAPAAGEYRCEQGTGSEQGQCQSSYDDPAEQPVGYFSHAGDQGTGGDGEEPGHHTEDAQVLCAAASSERSA